MGAYGTGDWDPGTGGRVDEVVQGGACGTPSSHACMQEIRGWDPNPRGVWRLGVGGTHWYLAGGYVTGSDSLAASSHCTPLADAYRGGNTLLGVEYPVNWQIGNAVSSLTEVQRRQRDMARVSYPGLCIIDGGVNWTAGAAVLLGYQLHW